MAVCSNCGKPTSEGDSFCKECATKIENGTEPETSNVSSSQNEMSPVAVTSQSDSSPSSTSSTPPPSQISPPPPANPSYGFSTATHKKSPLPIILSVALAVVVVACGALGFMWQNTKTTLTNDKTNLQNTISSLNGQVNDLNTKSIGLASQLSIAQSNLTGTQLSLTNAQIQLDTANAALMSYQSGVHSFGSLSELENWIVKTVRKDKATYNTLATAVNDSYAGYYAICSYFQQQASISGYALSTASVWASASTSGTSGITYSNMYYGINNIAYIGNKTYVIDWGTTYIDIYEVDSSAGFPGYASILLFDWEDVWTQALATI
ncbi:MAG: zinc ribbon domain-containing protein [Dehalogenimonas sp.]